jgi:hypothetical protein
MKRLVDVLPSCEVVIPLATSNYGGPVSPQERRGVMWHYDASKTDNGAENWFRSPAFKLSYTRAYTDGGRRIQLAPIDRAAYHAGVCKTTTQVRSANRAFYGLCVTAGDRHPLNAETKAVVTPEQFLAIVEDTALIAGWHQTQGHDWWTTDRIDDWLTGHNEWAVYPTTHALAGQFGRKVDPRGTDPKYEVLPINSGRQAVATLLESPSHDLWLRLKEAA